MTLVDNTWLRGAVAAFAERSEHDTYLRVLRNLQRGQVLFDITGSDIRTKPDGTGIEPGSRFAIRGGAGPDGQRALLVFTRQEEVAKLHPEGTATQTLGQPAASVLEFAQRQGDAWVYIDPAGPTCAVNVAEADFLLRNPTNVAVTEALPKTRQDVVDALAGGGSLYYAITEHPDGSIEVHTATGPGDAPVRVAFTSPVEIVASSPGAAWVRVDVARVVEESLTAPFAGLVINRLDPWVGLYPDELEAVRARLT